VYLCILGVLTIPAKRIHVIATTYDFKKMRNVPIGVKLRYKKEPKLHYIKVYRYIDMISIFFILLTLRFY
jgi:hypothetical protein